MKGKPSSPPSAPTPVPMKTAKVEKPVVTQAPAAKAAPPAAKKASKTKVSFYPLICYYTHSS